MFNSDLFLQGGVFVKPTSLKDIIDRRFNVVYGRNGSGKSTIARAFRSYQLNEPGERNLILSKDSTGSPLGEDWGRVFVFNEDFIKDNVKVDGLNSIVTIGKSAQNYDQIKDLEGQKQDLEKEWTNLNTQLEVFDGTDRKAGSVAEAEKRLTAGLKAGFIVRLSKVEGKKRNLMLDLYKPILSMNPLNNYSVKDGENVLNAKIDKYLLFQEGALIVWKAPNLSLLPDLDKVNELLSEKVKSAELTEEEQEIIADLSGALTGENYLPRTEQLMKGDIKYCPLCHQPLDNDYKKQLQDLLLRFRDKKVEEFQEKVRRVLAVISPIDSNLPDTGLAEHKDIFDAAKLSEERINERINEMIEALNAKISNHISAPVLSFDKQAYDTLVEEFSTAMDKVKKAVDNYNEKLQEKDQLYKEILAENQRLAFQENQDAIRVYNERVENRREIVSKISDLGSDIGRIDSELSSLQAQNDHVEEAMNQINHYLGIIFANKKLKLVTGDEKGKYKLLIKNGDKYVELLPTYISSGERNALALAYFFACVLKNKSEGYDYSDPAFLVIDDPVSSFDAENKAGVISLLSVQIKKILNGNVESKVLVLTHDFATLRELCDHRSHLFPDKDQESERATFIRIRSDHELRSVSCKIILENMEYYNDLQMIFQFAVTPNAEDYDGYDAMGNTVRSFAESYATRMFKCKWHDLFTDDRRLKCIDDDNTREKLMSFAIRPVLNSESHGVFASFEPSEVQRAARVLLIYMYYASREHLYAYLSGRNDASEWKIAKIENWVDDL